MHACVRANLASRRVRLVCVAQAWVGIKLVSTPESAFGGVVAGISVCAAPAPVVRGGQSVVCNRCGTAVPVASIVVHFGECASGGTAGGVPTLAPLLPFPTQFLLVRGATAPSSQVCLEASKFRLSGNLETLFYHFSRLLNHIVDSFNEHAYARSRAQRTHPPTRMSVLMAWACCHRRAEGAPAARAFGAGYEGIMRGFAVFTHRLRR